MNKIEREKLREEYRGKKYSASIRSDVFALLDYIDELQEELDDTFFNNASNILASIKRVRNS